MLIHTSNPKAVNDAIREQAAEENVLREMRSAVLAVAERNHLRLPHVLHMMAFITSEMAMTLWERDADQGRG